MDLLGATDTQDISVTVADVVVEANTAPTITSGVAFAVDENATASFATIAATDPESNPVTYSILSTASGGGVDAARFTINSATGALSFVNAPNFELPGDAGANNIYNLTVRATDSGGLTDTQHISVTVGNLDEAATGSIHIVSYATSATTVDLTAQNTLADPDLVTSANLTGAVQGNQWQQSLNGGLSWVDIAGATASTLTGINNSTVRVTTSYTDAFGTHNPATDPTLTIAPEIFVIGSGSADLVSGTSANDIMLGLGSNDVLNGNNGNDSLYGGTGNDTLNGDTGDDLLSGQEGDDMLVGGDGIDRAVYADI